MTVGKVTVNLPGIIVLNHNNGKVYVPQKAVDLLKAAGW